MASLFTSTEATSSAEHREEEPDKVLPFSTIPKFFGGLAAHDGDFFVLKGVMQETFGLIKAARDRRGLRTKFHYHPERKELLVTLPKMPHELVSGGISFEIGRSLVQMGLSDDDLWPANSTEFSGNGGAIGEPDACFVTRERGLDPSGWPTLVLETG
ncbi:hypothetical protein SEPCBS57363_006813, partial [Sporothrix epigloea]